MERVSDMVVTDLPPAKASLASSASGEWGEERCGASVSEKGAGTKEKTVRPLVHLFPVHRFRGWLPCSRTHTVGGLKPIDGSSHSILPA